MIEKHCEICSAPFSVKPYRKDKARFCSFVCGGKWHAKERLALIDKSYALGNKWRAGLRPANAFVAGEASGSNSPAWKEGDRRSCEKCGKDFNQKPWLSRQNGPARFCGRACFEASQCFVEEKSSVYVGGPTTYRGRGWLKIRAEVVADQLGDCADCGKHVGKSLPVHHKRPYREFDCSDTANARDNLVGLCQSCHMRHERRQLQEAAL